MSSTNILFLLLLCVLLFSNSTLVAQTETVFFEGEVTFEVTHESINENFTDQHFYYFFGNSMIGVVKEDIYKTTVESIAMGKITTYYDLKNKKIFIDFAQSDTIKWYPLDKQEGEIIYVERNKKRKKDALRSIKRIDYNQIQYGRS